MAHKRSGEIPKLPNLNDWSGMNIISKAIESLSGNWVQGRAMDRDGNRCGLGHLWAVAVPFNNWTVNDDGVVDSEEYMRISRTYYDALRVIEKTMNEQYPGRYKSFVHFNDSPDTTEADVIAVMEKAAVRMEEHE